MPAVLFRLRFAAPKKTLFATPQVLVQISTTVSACRLCSLISRCTRALCGILCPSKNQVILCLLTIAAVSMHPPTHPPTHSSCTLSRRGCETFPYPARPLRGAFPFRRTPSKPCMWFDALTGTFPPCFPAPSSMNSPSRPHVCPVYVHCMSTCPLHALVMRGTLLVTHTTGDTHCGWHTFDSENAWPGDAA